MLTLTSLNQLTRLNSATFYHSLNPTAPSSYSVAYNFRYG